MSDTGTGTWRPDAPAAAPDPALLRQWARQLIEDEDGFMAAFEPGPHGGLMQLSAAAWAPLAEALDAAELTALVRFFTLAEARYAGWEAGEKSPVIPLAAALRARQAFPAELRRWVRANSRNRFLPHGSLQGRL